MKNRSALFATLVAVGLLTMLPPAAWAAPFNECALTGATDGSGDPVAPPCVDSRPGDPSLAQTQDMICGAIGQSCVRFYILLVPDYDGNTETGLNFDSRLVWQESNGCSGLQRIRSSLCVGRDTALII